MRTRRKYLPYLDPENKLCCQEKNVQGKIQQQQQL